MISTVDIEIEVFAEMLVEEKFKILVKMYENGEIEKHQIKELLLNKRNSNECSDNK